ncbi:NAD(P)-dependent alcohol dehydrogenase [Agreia sp.]|uniref:NAD(P)-dependent alcohol dehydrogenase n=1 Tax=Agreia sp. TaxID=1872416 RepID=UPI0035BC94C7
MTDAPSPALPTRMRAVTQHRYGGPEVLATVDLPVPVPAATEVLVRVRAAGVDAGTVHILTGKPYLMRAIGFGLRAPRAPYPGRAFAGEVARVGSAVTGCAVGDRVVGSCSGTFAEYITVPEAALVGIPNAVPFETAATLPVSGVTALQALRVAGLETASDAETPRVLVLGGGGGVGSFAVQLAAANGATVTGVCSTSKLDFVRSLGAHDVIDYTVDDLASTARRWNVIIDAGGGRALGVLRRILSPDGHLVLVGAENGGALLGGLERVIGAGLLDRFTGQHLHGLVSRELTADLRLLLAEVAAGRLHPAIDRVYPLSEAAAALTRVASSKARGKVVVSI